MRKMILMMAAVFAILALPACDKYEDGRPSKNIINEFNRMYPDAWDIEWENEGAYWKVDFATGSRPNGVEHNAWYDLSGNWMKTVTEVALTAVPQKIKDYLAASEYGDAQYEDYFVDYYETTAGNFYRFDLHVEGYEVEVDVTEDGKVSLAGYDF